MEALIRGSQNGGFPKGWFLGDHQTYTTPTKGFRSQRDVFERVVHELSEPKRAATYVYITPRIAIAMFNIVFVGGGARIVGFEFCPERKPERGYIRMCPGTKTGTRVPSHVPRNENRNEGTFAKTLRNRPSVCW